MTQNYPIFKEVGDVRGEYLDRPGVLFRPSARGVRPRAVGSGGVKRHRDCPRDGVEGRHFSVVVGSVPRPHVRRSVHAGQPDPHHHCKHADRRRHWNAGILRQHIAPILPTVENESAAHKKTSDTIKYV